MSIDQRKQVMLVVLKRLLINQIKRRMHWALVIIKRRKRRIVWCNKAKPPPQHYHHQSSHYHYDQRIVEIHCPLHHHLNSPLQRPQLQLMHHQVLLTQRFQSVGGQKFVDFYSLNYSLSARQIVRNFLPLQR